MHALLTAEECTILFHYVAESPTLLRILKEICISIGGARLSMNGLSQAVAELITIEWEVSAFLATACEGKSSNNRNGIKMVTATP